MCRTLFPHPPVASVTGRMGPWVNHAALLQSNRLSGLKHANAAAASKLTAQKELRKSSEGAQKGAPAAPPPPH